jgi:hypothetical protein
MGITGVTCTIQLPDAAMMTFNIQNGWTKGS